MRTRRRATIEDLRLAIDCLPRRTRIAMLQGIEANDIIVGAYANRDGICPMLAAHRAGGRTSLIAFADSWDRLAFRGARKARARRATERELLILRSHLEASLLEEHSPAGELAAARREHEELLARRERAPRPSAPEPTQARMLEPTPARRPEPTPPRTPEPTPPRTPEPTPQPTATRPGDPDRAPELSSHPGWAWTRAVRRYDDYQRILERLHAMRRSAERDAERPAVRS